MKVATQIIEVYAKPQELNEEDTTVRFTIYGHDVDLPLGLHVRVLECRTLLPHGTRSGPRSSRDDNDKTKGQSRNATSADSHRRSR